MPTIATGALIDANDLLVSLTKAGILFHVQHGNYADRAASPVVGQVYVATDVKCVLACFVAGAWVNCRRKNYARDMTQVSCANAAPRVSIFHFHAAPNHLVVGRSLNLHLTGVWNNGTGGSRTPYIDFNFNGSSTEMPLNAAIPTGTNGTWEIQIRIFSTASNAQKLFMRYWFLTTAGAHYDFEAIYDSGVDTSGDTPITVSMYWDPNTITSCTKEQARAWLSG